LAPPAGATIRHHGDVLEVNTVRGGKFKLQSDSPRGWIAATVGGDLLLEQAGAGEADGPPDGGCTTGVYSHSGLGYSELELLTPEVHLAPGEDLERVLTLSIHAIPDAGTQGLARLIRETVGEVDAAAKADPARAE
jgi:hypothetical protein